MNGRFTMMDQEVLLHSEQDRARWRVAYAVQDSKAVEAHYMARLIRGLDALGIGPVARMGNNDPVDLTVAGHAVEVKIARARAKDRHLEVYQGSLHDPNKRHTLNGSVVILVCVDKADRLWPYVIPRRALGDRRTIEITSHPKRYGGQWRQYLEAWQYLGAG